MRWRCSPARCDSEVLSWAGEPADSRRASGDTAAPANESKDFLVHEIRRSVVLATAEVIQVSSLLAAHINVCDRVENVHVWSCLIAEFHLC